MCFDRAHPKLTVSDVARLTGSSPASARRSLRTLHALGYLAHDGKLFWLLPRTLLLANAYLASRPIPTIAQPLLDSLAERTHESASIAKLVGGHAVIIARSTARKSLSVGLGIGSRLPAYASATGRVLLAALPPAQALRRVKAMSMESLTPKTVTTVDGVMASIEACRTEGYAVCDGELELAVCSLAVPVLNHYGETIAALSIAVQTARMGIREFKQSFLPVLRRSQTQLKTRLYED